MAKTGVYKDCEYCGKSFYVQKHRADRAKFCSMQCLWAGREPNGNEPPTGLVKTCQLCGSEFYVPAYRETTARFCSNRCTSRFYAAEREDARLKAIVKHGNARRDDVGKKSYRSPEYRSWESMKRRCERDLWYVENGITICWKWRYNFAAFLADMGPKPSPTHSLDRYPDALGNYEPGNCRWATSYEQGWSKRGKKASAETRRKMSEARRKV